MTNGSDWLAEQFGISREAHRFDFYWIRLSYQAPILLRTSVNVISRKAMGLLSDAPLKTGASLTDLWVMSAQRETRSFPRYGLPGPDVTV